MLMAIVATMSEIEDVLRAYHYDVSFADPGLDQKLSVIRDTLAGLGLPHITPTQARTALVILGVSRSLNEEGNVLLCAYLGTLLEF